ncbi:MAG: glycoside hydrolase family 3 protein [Clostridia bacterium]|nr:glycoside hydrolase family 3 protein [Clostridia bacterium]
MLKELTLNEKIGQMIMIGIDGNEINDRIKKLILNYKVGGVILYRKNFKTYMDMLKIIHDLKELNASNKVPLFIAIDQEGGRVNRMPPEIHNIKNALKLSRARNLNVIREAADITGTILEESGYNMKLSPVLDVLCKNTSEAIGNRCFGDNPEDVSEYGIQTMCQLQKHKIISVIKHFPGQGFAKFDSHYVLPRIKQIDQKQIKPFVDAIEHGADAMMVGHMVIKRMNLFTPASLSKKVIKEIRLKYNFKGLIMTDDLKMRAVRYLYGTKRSVKKAFLAGNDIILFRFKKADEDKSIRYIQRLVRIGKISEQRINQSVIRILDMKEKYEINDKKVVKGCNIEEINNRIDMVNSFVEESDNT